MPELPEVETVCRELAGSITGATIEKIVLRRKDLRLPFPKNFAKQMCGRKIRAVTRRAKYILFHLDDKTVLLSHLGMSGSFSVGVPTDYQPHDHVIFTLGDKRVLTYNDPRRFGLMTLVDEKTMEAHSLLAHLGPEPFSAAFNARYLAAQCGNRHGAIKTVLMDQTLVVGVGNIYANEALFLAGIHPEKPAHKTVKSAASMVNAIREVLAAAIESGGSSLRDFVHISGESGYFQHRFNVYGRAGKPCLICNTTLKTIRQAGRSSFYCPACQR